jgi:glycosyltransferase involved in cell wall biosynthesis
MRRILHVSTSFSGGAAIASRRIVHAQREAGLDSQLFGFVKGGEELQDFEHPLEVGRKFQLISKGITFSQARLLQNSENLVTSFSTSIVSQLLDLSSGYDLLNLHATYNLLDAKGMNLLSQKIPIVLTLHDQRWITGGCHYAWSCQGYVSSCSNCPQVRKVFRNIPQRQLSQAKSHLKGKENIQLVTPSTWLAESVSRSSLFCNHSVSVISNPIPVPPHEKGLERTNSRSTGPLYVGFISENLNNPNKGLDVLVRALEEASKVRSVVLYLYGHGTIPKIVGSVEVHQSQFRSDEARLSAVRSCDVVVIPSYQDNSPSVAGECLVAGVPLISSSAGGLHEIVKEMKLPFFEPGNWRELAQCLIQHPGQRLSEKQVLYAQRKYSPERSAQKYQRLYESTITGFKGQ